MNKCGSCGHINNDGSTRCINCGAALSVKPSDFEVYINNQKKQRSKAYKKLAILFITIGVVAVIAFGFFIIRVNSASTRAETLVYNYIMSHVQNVDDITMYSMGSCLSGGYFSGSGGFAVFGNVTINGTSMPFSSDVSMRGVFDSGRITSVKISYQEIYK